MKTIFKLIAVISVVLLALVIILIWTSLISLEYYEMGFLRSRTTGSVRTDKVYQAGLHLADPDKNFKVFKSSAHSVNFRTEIFTSDRLEIGIRVSFHYFLRPHQLERLHKTFDIYYEPVLRKNALDALKNAATFYSTREYIRERQKVENGLRKAIADRLGGRCCEFKCGETDEDPCEKACKKYDSCIEDDWGLFSRVKYFQLRGIDIPNELDSRFQRALILQERQARAEQIQKAVVIRKESDQLVKQIENEANVIQRQANANSTLILNFATNEGVLLRENARRDGLKLMYNELNITTQKERAAFDYLRTLRRSSQLRLAVAYSQYIAGTFK